MLCRDAYADHFGLKYQLQRRFKVKVTCGRKQPHYLAGYLGLSYQRRVIKCYLNVWMSRLSALRLCRYSGINWYLILFLSLPCLRLDDASFSRMWIFGLFPLVVNVYINDIVTSRISVELWVLVGIAWILLLL